MSIAVEWDDEERTILHYTFESPWTWEEYHAAIARAWEMAAEVDHPTDTITDMRNSRLLPDNVFRHVRQSMVEIPESTRTVVIVGAGMLVQALLNILRRVYRNQDGLFFTAETLEEARELIYSRRETDS